MSPTRRKTESEPQRSQIETLLRQWAVSHKGIRVEAYISTVLTVLKLKFYMPPAKYGYILPPFELNLPLPLPDRVNIMLPGRYVILQFSRFNEVCFFLHDKSLIGSENKNTLKRMSSIFFLLWRREKGKDTETTVFKRYQKNENKVYLVSASSAVVEEEAYIMLRCHRFCCPEIKKHRAVPCP
eukprot:gb/GEZJ01001533.1/.p1 GENE.gb/GEZJ01001533.1/~~gb/GEZJ01001533.1/.p1  ORF type:complete len:183 (+),score=13.56 gb/GEZJ01001533.1/:1299-1847(+)